MAWPSSRSRRIPRPVSVDGPRDRDTLNHSATELLKGMVCTLQGLAVHCFVGGRGNCACASARADFTLQQQNRSGGTAEEEGRATECYTKYLVGPYDKQIDTERAFLCSTSPPPCV